MENMLLDGQYFRPVLKISGFAYSKAPDLDSGTVIYPATPGMRVRISESSSFPANSCIEGSHSSQWSHSVANLLQFAVSINCSSQQI